MINSYTLSRTLGKDDEIMKNLGLAVGIFVAAFAVTAACQRKKRSDRVMSFYELYNDNDVELGELING